MSDYSHLTLAKLQMDERIEQNRRSQLARPPRRSRRHRVAHSLHALADRLDV